MLALLAAVLLTIAGRVSSQAAEAQVPTGSAPHPPAERCGADRYRVGDVAPSALPPPNRLIRSGSDTALVLNFSAARLNIEVGADGKIVRAWCG